jgi:predicted transposase/invertase (TIGR01784 family)
MLNKFLDPKNDLAFRRIFGTEKNKDILIHFLNDMFGRTTDPIEKVSFLKPQQEPEIDAQRVSIVDVLCEDTLGNRFIIEMQVAKEKGFAKRAQYYAAKAYITQREKGIEYRDLKEVTLLSIANFVLFPDKPNYLSHHVILDQNSLERDLKDFSFSFLELPKFKKTQQQLVTMTEKWAYFFKHAEATHEKEIPQLVGNDLILGRAYEELNRFGWSADELWNYDRADMKRSADEAVLEAALEDGIAIGEVKGKKETLILMVKNLHKEGVSIELIQKTTDLSLKEIHAILDF